MFVIDAFFKPKWFSKAEILASNYLVFLVTMMILETVLT